SVADLDWLRGFVRLLAVRDTIAVVVDAHAASEADREATLASLRDQVYPYYRAEWLDDANAVPSLEGAVAVCAVEAGDVLDPEALLSLAIELNDGADIVYTDEDRFDAGGIPRDPAFKPGWSPETALTRDYVGRLCAIRTAVLTAAGGLDPAHGAAAWYDALLRVSESSDRVAHVPRVLLHRKHGGGVVPPDAAEVAVRRALARRGEAAVVEVTPLGTVVRYAVRPDDRVTVIIPTRDRADLLERCLVSLFERTEHPNFDVLVVDNGSAETATRALFERWREHRPGRFRVLEDPEPFNYSRLNNRGVAATDAPYVVMLNNDTEVIAPEWMTAMLGQARRPRIGAVGALLLYEDGTIQHAGVVLGGVVALAGHAYRFLDPAQLADDERLVLDTNYLAVTGACLMVSRSKYQEVGGLDESLAVSYNDIDFCLKLCAAGYRNVMVPRARLYHYESKSRGRDDTKQKVAVAVSEADAIRTRWPEWARRDPYYNPNLTLDAEDFSFR
ncbi:MAG TPA: glycosyltransferase family 2 protein, partial [Candidatus Lustribacter sp.]|nr:glycosyltransferase family 2 protein [Candidatus Lustribacter sp.]